MLMSSPRSRKKIYKDPILMGVYTIGGGEGEMDNKYSIEGAEGMCDSKCVCGHLRESFTFQRDW